MNPDTHTLAGPYALHALTDDERTEFERHLRTCFDCQADVDSFAEQATALSTLTITAPPAGLRDAVLMEIRGVRPLPPILESSTAVSDAPSDAEGSTSVTSLDSARAARSARSSRLLVAVAAAVVAIGVVVWSPWTSPQSDPPQLTATEKVLEAKDAETHVTSLGDTTFTVVRSTQLQQAVLIGENVPSAPNGSTYQAWFMVDNVPVDAGVMPPAEDGSMTFLLEGDASAATVVAISVEPPGGSDAPTGSIVGQVALGD